MRTATQTLAFPGLTRSLILAIVTGALLLGVVALTPSSVSASDATAPLIEEVVYIDSDVGDGGLSGAGASDWLPFAIMLAPFVILITGLLWLTFGIDRSEGREE